MAANSKSQKIVVVDIGKKSRKKIKALKRGEGERVEEIATSLRAQAGPSIDAVDTIPVLLLFEKKRKRKKGMPMPLLSPLLKY